MDITPKEVNPERVIQQVVDKIPDPVRQHVIIIGSLAAAYALRHRMEGFSVRTKDVDSVMSPRDQAPHKGAALADALIHADWEQKEDGKHGKPGTSTTPDDELPALRLYPPDSKDWFIEFLTEPDTGQTSKSWTRFTLSNGDNYGLPSFQFTGVATYNAKAAEELQGVRIALPSMMALANLLEHDQIGTATIGDTAVKRSNKDLGRVLALAYLEEDDQLDNWGANWAAALQALFPEEWETMATSAGSGLHALIGSEEDFEEAYVTCLNGLLANQDVSRENLKVAAERLIEGPIADLEKKASQN